VVPAVITAALYAPTKAALGEKAGKARRANGPDVKRAKSRSLTEMAKNIVTAKCKGQAKWEAGFRSHADFFKSAYGLSKAVSYGLGEDNYVGTCFETNAVAKFMAAVGSPETAEAMEGDGLLPETVKILVLDKELAI
jgi:hypothetical protein